MGESHAQFSFRTTRPTQPSEQRSETQTLRHRLPSAFSHEIVEIILLPSAPTS